MLGINTKRTLIKDGFARKIRDKVQRIQTGQLNEQDREEIRKNRRIIQNISVEIYLLFGNDSQRIYF